MSEAKLKDEAHRLVDALPDDATWDDLMYRLYVRQSIEQGIAAADDGRLSPVSDVRVRLVS